MGQRSQRLLEQHESKDMLRPPRFYFSFQSPYSWIAARLLEQQYATDQIDVEYIPTWNPDEATRTLLEESGGKVLYSAMSREKHLYILQDIKRLTTLLGYSIRWPIDRQPWWELPNLAYLAACHEGKGRDLFWKLYNTRWEEGGDICSREVIGRLAQQLDLDPEVLARAPENPHLRRAGAAALYSCYRDGVFGVPFFVHGHEKFWGVDRVRLFVAALTGQAVSYP